MKALHIARCKAAFTRFFDPVAKCKATWRLTWSKHATCAGDRAVEKGDFSMRWCEASTSSKSWICSASRPALSAGSRAEAASTGKRKSSPSAAASLPAASEKSSTRNDVLRGCLASRPLGSRAASARPRVPLSSGSEGSAVRKSARSLASPLASSPGPAPTLPPALGPRTGASLNATIFSWARPRSSDRFSDREFSDVRAMRASSAWLVVRLARSAGAGT
mmetsp:Transcript_76917/g.220231  ORF Transcript_76917/g.220231 Transcript_76917/m.220231 type:complete len:220 (-) Transcript_76917:1274-1933(-)